MMNSTYYLETDDKFQLNFCISCHKCGNLNKFLKNLLKNQYIFCSSCNLKYEYHHGIILPENVSFLENEELIGQYIIEDVIEFFETIVSSIEELNIKHIFNNVVFRYDILNTKLNASASFIPSSNNKTLIHISNLIFVGVCDYFLKIMSDENFLFFESEDLFLERTSAIDIFPSLTLKELIDKHKNGLEINPLSSFNKIDFKSPFNYLIYKKFQFFAFCYIFFHELSHIKLGHLEYVHRNFSLNLMFINRLEEYKNLEILQAFEISADISSIILTFRLIYPIMNKKPHLNHELTDSIDQQTNFMLLLSAFSYTPIILPYYFSLISPIIELNYSHPPSILRSYYCMEGLLSATKGILEKIKIKYIWEKYQNNLIEKNYFGEKNILKTDNWKNKDKNFYKYLEILKQNNFKLTI